jgi:hypothetical protein
VRPAESQWGTGPAILPAGAQAAVLYGDPTKDGLFSMRFKLPKGYRVPPYTLSKAVHGPSNLKGVRFNAIRIDHKQSDMKEKGHVEPKPSLAFRRTR